MNTSKSIVTASNSLIERELPDVSEDTRQLVSLGRGHQWPFRALGKAPLLEEPVRFGDWLLIPGQSDTTPIPERTMTRIQAIFAAGIQPKGFVVVHEAPRLLKAPVETREQRPALAEAAFLPQSSSDALAAFGTVMSAVASMILPMFLFMAAAMVDPILVAVTDDDTWIEIDRWQTE